MSRESFIKQKHPSFSKKKKDLKMGLHMICIVTHQHLSEAMPNTWTLEKCETNRIEVQNSSICRNVSHILRHVKRLPSPLTSAAWSSAQCLQPFNWPPADWVTAVKRRSIKQRQLSQKFFVVFGPVWTIIKKPTHQKQHPESPWVLT